MSASTRAAGRRRPIERARGHAGPGPARAARRRARDADTRALLELAKGVLVERLHCGPAQAARQLRELAGRSGRSELEFAADIVNNAARDRIAEATLEFPAIDAEPVLRMRTAESGILAASDAQAVAESLLAHALAPLGAVGVAIWAAGSDSSLTLAGFAGFTAAEAQRWRYVPPGVATTARRALTDRHTIWFDTITGGDPVSIGYRETPGGGRVAVPGHRGRADPGRAGDLLAAPACRRSRPRSSARSRRWPNCARTPWRAGRSSCPGWTFAAGRRSPNWSRWRKACSTRPWCCARNSTNAGS